MRRISEKLYYGEIYRNENVLPRGEEIKQVNTMLNKLEDEFISRLSKEEFKLLEYEEVDGILYPKIQISNDVKDDDRPLGKYGRRKTYIS